MPQSSQFYVNKFYVNQSLFQIFSCSLFTYFLTLLLYTCSYYSRLLTWSTTHLLCHVYLTKINTWNVMIISLHPFCFLTEKAMFSWTKIFSRYYPHSTEIFRKYCRNIPWKYCKIAKIFRNLTLILLKYCNNLAMSAQNMAYAIFSKYCQI